MSTRREALRALLDITEGGAYANLRLGECADRMSERDAKWVAAAVYTALDNLIYIDRVIDALARGRLDKSIRGILRLGVCQALFMNTPARAACDESVKLAREIGKAALSGYVNAVMRSVCSSEPPALPLEPRERMSVEFSWPRWIVDKYCDAYGEDLARERFAYKEHGFAVRAQHPFTAGALAEELERREMPFVRGELADDAFRLESGLDLGREPLFLSGRLTVQSESAMLVCRLLGAKKGMRILDACAAPGGKSAYIANLLDNDCAIDAWDIHDHRTLLCLKTFERLHVTCARVERRDAAIYDPSLEEKYDAVLLDVPCSGLGVAGKPDIRYAKSESVLLELAAAQEAILSACSRYVKRGGALMYATCTELYEENGGRVRAFLNEHSDFAPADIGELLPQKLAGRFDGIGLQLFAHWDGSEGFYMSKLVRM